MAERRMLARSLIESDRFSTMSMEAKLLYVYLNLEADDDGFVITTKKAMIFTDIQKDIGEKAIEELVKKKFLIKFDSDVILIRHWRQQNQISPSKHKDTLCQEELAQVYFNEKTKLYELLPADFVRGLSAECPRSIDQYSIDKVSIDENREDKYSLVETSIGESRLPDCLRFSSLDEVICTD